jgi:serine protease Do
VKDADEIVVRLQDRRELVAKLVGSDKRSDIALLKVAAEGLPVLKIGSADKMKVGEWVFAIGSPFNFDHSVTAGIVSAKGRSLPDENYVPFIQTDVAINPGNSGGPLFNLAGEVVGVNSQIYSRTGGYQGLSFAIPIDVAMEVVDQLKSQGRVSRGWLGVQIQDVTRELAESFGMKKPQGALVSKVMEKSPAEAAGIQVGDIITEFNGREIVSSASLPPMVGMTKIGETAKVKLLRQGETKEVPLKIGMLPEEEPAAAGKEESPTGEKVNRLGLSVGNPTPEQREMMGVAKGGVLVMNVTPGAGYEAGLRRGDLIVRVQDQAIKDVKHFNEVVKGLPKGKSVAILVQRPGGSMFLALKIKD